MGLLALLTGLLLIAAICAAGIMRWRAREELRASLWERLEALDGERVRFERPEGRGDWAERGMRRTPRLLRIWLGRADVHPSGRSVALYLTGTVIVALLVGKFLGLFAALAAILLCIAAPLSVLCAVASRRTAAFLAGLPYFLDAVRQLLVVGNSIQQALVKASEGSAPAVQRYLQPSMRRILNGGSIPEAILVAADRVALAELYMLATAVRTNMRFGGAMAPILGDFADMLRDRARIGREIAAATSETRLSAVILMALPLIAIALLALLNFKYISFLWTSDIGQRMLMVALVLQAIGALVLRRLMRLDF